MMKSPQEGGGGGVGVLNMREGGPRRYLGGVIERASIAEAPSFIEL